MVRKVHKLRVQVNLVNDDYYHNDDNDYDDDDDDDDDYNNNIIGITCRIFKYINEFVSSKT